MNKVFIFLIISLIVLSGCSKQVEDFKKENNNTSEIVNKLEIITIEESPDVENLQNDDLVIDNFETVDKKFMENIESDIDLIEN